MNTMKKLAAIVLALVMATALCIPALADEGTHTISLKENDTHSYYVYQVLTGTRANESNEKLYDLDWGADAIADPGDVNDFVASITAEGLSEKDIVQRVAAKVETSGTDRDTLSSRSPLSGLATGYYLLVDTDGKTDSRAGGIDPAYLHVICVVENINGLEIKYSATESHKEITGDTLGDATEQEPRSPEAPTIDNVSIGDTVYYRITADVPANAAAYDYYYFVINDTLDQGLTLNPESIAVYAVENDTTPLSAQNQLKADADYSVKTGEASDPCSFQVGLIDAKEHAGDTIIVTCSAVLNENATIGETPNRNTSTLTYSKNPNHAYGGEMRGPETGFPDPKDLDALGETPASVTETYTTGIEIRKVDENGNVLTGAEFTITGDSTETVLVSYETFTVAEKGEYYRLNNGTYIIAEDTEIAPDQHDGKRYDKSVTYTPMDTTGEGAAEAKAEVGPDGVVRFIGLGAGTYTITETKTPEGYNTLAPMEVTIEFKADPVTGAVQWTTTSTDARYNPDAGVFEMTIVNNRGTELPETGGIGTKIFYALGAVLVVGAGVVLIARKRAEE